MPEYKIGDRVNFITTKYKIENTGIINKVVNDEFGENTAGKAYEIKGPNGIMYYTGFTNKGIGSPSHVEINYKMEGGRRKKSKRKIMRKKSTRRRK